MRTILKGYLGIAGCYFGYHGCVQWQHTNPRPSILDSRSMNDYLYRLIDSKGGESLLWPIELYHHYIKKQN